MSAGRVCCLSLPVSGDCTLQLLHPLAALTNQEAALPAHLLYFLVM